jgi:hypothetical protein
MRSQSVDFTFRQEPAPSSSWFAAFIPGFPPGMSGLANYLKAGARGIPKASPPPNLIPGPNVPPYQGPGYPPYTNPQVPDSASWRWRLLNFGVALEEILKDVLSDFIVCISCKLEMNKFLPPGDNSARLVYPQSIPAPHRTDFLAGGV